MSIMRNLLQDEKRIFYVKALVIFYVKTLVKISPLWLLQVTYKMSIFFFKPISLMKWVNFNIYCVLMKIWVIGGINGSLIIIICHHSLATTHPSHADIISRAVVTILYPFSAPNPQLHKAYCFVMSPHYHHER